MTLTSDQRWLLATVGGGQMVWALTDPTGTRHLMESRLGHLGSAIDGAPEWMTSFDTAGSRVCSPSVVEPKVTVTAMQIDRYAAGLPQVIVAELKACRSASLAEGQRVSRWCHCGHEADCHRANQGDPLYGARHHPTEAEDQAHLDEVWRTRDWQDGILVKALRLGAEVTEQLDLFGAAS